ncbi:MAG TPA: helix-turn-helix transcriptional regulator [Terriglobales bacterium]|nr:helix-turn-helix transcriptional regulator [Terriglobales bacterium]
MKSHSRPISSNNPSAGSSRADRHTKLRLASAIKEAIRQQQLSQSEAAALLGIPQPKVSALVNFHLEGFSVQRLFRALNALGRDVVIQISSKNRGSAGKTFVSAT